MANLIGSPAIEQEKGACAGGNGAAERGVGELGSLLRKSKGAVAALEEAAAMVAGAARECCCCCCCSKLHRGAGPAPPGSSKLMARNRGAGRSRGLSELCTTVLTNLA